MREKEAGRKNQWETSENPHIVRCIYYFTLKNKLCKGGKHFLDERTKTDKNFLLVC